jgi:hypothetical protein
VSDFRDDDDDDDDARVRLLGEPERLESGEKVRDCACNRREWSSKRLRSRCNTVVINS